MLSEASRADAQNPFLLLTLSQILLKDLSGLERSYVICRHGVAAVFFCNAGKVQNISVSKS